eukprot:TRINITY_DN2996_c1_g2_i1.p3 TRINITY_DN2996_c1_g2~~TRINITY_DN2996_c1_g2_i1.p3  ORF type:complete len:219 (+),score=71.99 TRINITY_DN2996_c1_g2_i1:893-1549(+)
MHVVSVNGVPVKGHIHLVTLTRGMRPLQLQLSALPPPPGQPPGRGKPPPPPGTPPTNQVVLSSKPRTDGFAADPPPPPPPRPPPPPPGRPPPPAAQPLRPGDHVEAHGLSNGWLNGMRGRVDRVDRERAGVDFGGQGKHSLRFSNLRRVPAPKRGPSPKPRQRRGSDSAQRERRKRRRRSGDDEGTHWCPFCDKCITVEDPRCGVAYRCPNCGGKFAV